MKELSMSLAKYIVRKVVPERLRGLIGAGLSQLFTPELTDSRDNYRYSDEKSKFVHILEAMNYLRIAGDEAQLPSVYLEFGCHSARTFSAAVNAARYLSMRDTKFYAFDSFEGLPSTSKAEDGYFERGSFATSKEQFLKLLKVKTGIELHDSHIIKGWYEDTLTLELANTMPKAGVVHIDVDLYSSTVAVMEFIRPLLCNGTVLLFDDWYCFPPGKEMGELRAVNEFTRKYSNFKIQPWKAYSTFGQSFFVTSLP